MKHAEKPSAAMVGVEGLFSGPRSASLGFPPRVAPMGPPLRAQLASAGGEIGDRTRGGTVGMAH